MHLLTCEPIEVIYVLSIDQITALLKLTFEDMTEDRSVRIDHSLNL